MEEFQTKQKSNFFMGLICLIAGALVTCVLYFGISRLGFFSFWVSAIGITISLMGYNHFVKGSGNFGFILGAILNAAGIIYGEFLDGCAEIAKSYGMSMTDLLKEALTTGSFWIYPGIGIAIILLVGFQNRKADFSDKDDE
ncbi:hypothetical protein [Fusobacterium hwasookii]|uniref:Uncharacterized protein n=1 Tax=Fusobacterium hwasookii ChDC F128 TaxID=1216362 RepID=A0ABP2RCB3_9FUSO|nr:hypothetical protein [Fusobacterium hwasookii]EJU08821.1 hypothetical protein B437_01805 [Fusobacterium hwasookii ChDC F128]